MTPPPAGVQDRAVYDYLYQLSEYLGVALSGGVTEGVATGGAAAEMRAGGKTGKSEESDEYNALKSLVIKTATETYREIEQLGAKLTGEYVAISNFGTYVENLSMELEANPDAITQYYKFFSDLKSNVAELNNSFSDYKTNTEAYIRTGVVYYDGAIPVYGVAVGQGLTTTEVDGDVIEQTNFRAIFTAQELSFWQDSNKVAYVSNNKLYITSITVLSNMDIGPWRISSSNGLAFRWIGR